MRRRNLLIGRRNRAIETHTGPVRRAQDDLDQILARTVLELRQLGLHRGDEDLDVLGQHFRGELDVADGHAHGADLLPVVLGADHLVHHGDDAPRDGVGFERGHETLRTEDAAQAGLLQGRLGVGVADEPVEGQLVGVRLDQLEQGFLAEGHGARGLGLLHDAAVLLADDGDAGVVLHGVRQP